MAEYSKLGGTEIPGPGAGEESANAYWRDRWNALMLQQAARPDRPAFESIRGSNGLLQPQYQLQSQLDPRAMEAARTEGLRPAGQESPWAAIAKQQQMDALTRQQQSGLSTAKNQLAMSGGLRTGAAERLAAQSMRGGLAARQDVGSQIKMQDEQNRQRWLQNLPGMEINQANTLQGVDQFNISNTMQDITQKRLSDIAAYQEQMRAWAAERTAKATPSGGKK